MTQGAAGPGEGREYRRCRFVARIPTDRVYTRDHYWLKEEGAGLWRVGLTPWAVRMLGDLVEYRREVEEGEGVKAGQAVGSLEGFKAVVEIRAVGAGRLVRWNPVLGVNLDAITLDCHGEGWLYVMEGRREAEVREAAGYRVWLDETIDAVRGGSLGEGT